MRGVGLDFGIGVLVADGKVHACTCGMNLRREGWRRLRRRVGVMDRYAALRVRIAPRLVGGNRTSGATCRVGAGMRKKQNCAIDK